MKIAANTMLLWLKEETEEDYNNVVCLTNHGLNLSRGTNDDATFCGPDSSPGAITGDISISGKTFLNPETGTISAPKLLQWMQAGTTLDWKTSPAEPTTGDWIKQGKGFASAWNDAYDVDQTGNFGTTLTLKGDVDSYIVGESGGVTGDITVVSASLTDVGLSPSEETPQLFYRAAITNNTDENISIGSVDFPYASRDIESDFADYDVFFTNTTSVDTSGGLFLGTITTSFLGIGISYGPNVSIVPPGQTRYLSWFAIGNAAATAGDTLRIGPAETLTFYDAAGEVYTGEVINNTANGPIITIV